MVDYLSDSVGPVNVGVIDPADVLDFVVDFSEWLQDGETISSHTLTADNVTIDSDDADNDSVTIWLSAGIVNRTATVTTKVVTTESRTAEKSFTLKVRQR